MRKIGRYIIKNWAWIIAGLLATGMAADSCYEQRGGFYIGGEFFILPVILITVSLVPAIIRDILDVFREEDEEDAGLLAENRRRMAGKGHRLDRRGGRRGLSALPEEDGNFQG